jgi:hypothetical protein
LNKSGTDKSSKDAQKNFCFEDTQWKMDGRIKVTKMKRMVLKRTSFKDGKTPGKRK